MKFSEFDHTRWAELQLYFDTCVLPVTGMTGAETPAEATEKLEKLRDLLDLVEVPFKGRTVTYPALHYTGEGSRLEEAVAFAAGKMKKNGFKHVIVVSLPELGAEVQDVDYVIYPSQEGDFPLSAEVMNAVQQLWRKQNES
ncbi:DUF2487 domain-containing protein [Paenibacillus sambharensis]|uniref:DUF2487 domain-containing protein n=1 Tax=Paenibacillus sambharensis TaxID=1803190 RepID=A0A2W1LP01_9BACL|nr:DUF2487 family protein [Paenibacillus sambharensis]PZD93551.1 DUF2487 domain-containing protein [Paenibacillus sambharensis]